ncbi:CDP-glycerol glycerophosphotransferase family protein [Geodermatophilus sp. URMC 63]
MHPWLSRATRHLTRAALDLANAAVPKRQQLLLNLYPDTDASLPPLLAACRDTQGRVVVLLTDPTSAVAARVREALGARARVHRRGSLPAAWQYLRSASVVFTHPVHDTARLSPRQTLVDVWHGMPIKAIGRLDGSADTVPADWTLASSDFYRPIVAEALGVPPESVVALNSPRIEHLCRRHEDVWDRLGIDRRAHDRVLVWMPTFRGREPERGGSGVQSARLLSADGAERLAALLERRRCLLVLRRHPYEARTAPVPVPGVLELTDAVLEAAGVGVYEVLAEADGLVTDVSSVWLDHLLLDRPVVIWFPDVGEYTADRPLLLEPYGSWTPGPVLVEEDDLLAALDAVAAGEDPHRVRRREVRQLLMGEEREGVSARVLALAGIHRRLPSGR